MSFWWEFDVYLFTQVAAKRRIAPKERTAHERRWREIKGRTKALGVHFRHGVEKSWTLACRLLKNEPVHEESEADMKTINRIRLQARAARKIRECLHCGKLFLSSGPGNRRCSRCSKDLSHVVVRAPLRCFMDNSGFGRLRDSDLVQTLVTTSAGSAPPSRSTEDN